MRNKKLLIEEGVAENRISETATIYPGCRILGKNTLICRDAELGFEAPVTLNNCFVGPGVRLKGGYFENAVFLEGAEAGSGAHVRGGTIFEEGASIAHTVGLKQTILFPFVTLGSLINFCDCFMAGGTSRKNHSEVGSSYIHFNYTPNQDKATASMMGDVPDGVMLDQNPIFLGGQGGLVGPCRIAYGTVIAAGSIYRKDQPKPDRLVFEGGGRGGSVPYSTGIYRMVKRQARNNIVYLSNLVALMVWYRRVRCQFIGDGFPQPLYQGLVETLDAAIGERVKRFCAFCEKLKQSSILYRQQAGEGASSSLLQQKAELYDHRDQIVPIVGDFLDRIDDLGNDGFEAILGQRIQSAGPNYIDVVKGLSEQEKNDGRAWLQGIVDAVTGKLLEVFPSLDR